MSSEPGAQMSLSSWRSSFYWDMFECIRKKKNFGKTKRRGRGTTDTNLNLKNHLTYLFMARVLSTHYLLYFLFIYYFIKKYSNLFPIKWINQIFFYFSSNHYLNKFISPYLFNYKNLTIFLKLFFLTKKIFLIYFTKK